MALCCLRIFSFLFSWSKDMPITLGDTSITGITGNQGIGTDAPSYQLDVSKSVNSDFVARIRNTAGATSSDNALLVETNTASGARIISARNAGAERFSVSGNGDVDVYNTFKFNSGYGSSVTAYGCRAWVNFDGTGSTGAKTIRGSGGVSSIVKTATGIFTLNFSTAMPDVNYCPLAWDVNYGMGWYNLPFSVGSFVFHRVNNSFSNTDNAQTTVAVFR
jgi:hypothetical protein